MTRNRKLLDAMWAHATELEARGERHLYMAARNEILLLEDRINRALKIIKSGRIGLGVDVLEHGLTLEPPDKAG
jgi:hypothetical protein